MWVSSNKSSLTKAEDRLDLASRLLFAYTVPLCNLCSKLSVPCQSEVRFYWELLDFPGCSDGKGPACDAGDLGVKPGLGRSFGEGIWQPTPVFLPGEFHEQRSLVGYSPWGCKGSDTTEQLSLPLTYQSERK